MTLAKFIQNKNNFDGVSMIRLIYEGKSHDYTRWKLSGQNIFFFDNHMKVGHVLWTTESSKEIDDNRIIINPDSDPKYTVGLEIYYGGAIL